MKILEADRVERILNIDSNIKNRFIYFKDKLILLLFIQQNR